MIYNKIYDFCKVRNAGPATKNGNDGYTPRIEFILGLLDSLNIQYEVDSFNLMGNTLYNIILPGTSKKWVMAHHDVCNPNIDNANDNSASVINAIALKNLKPELNIILVDGEEPPVMGGGSNHFAKRIIGGDFDVDWVLNLELTGSGGKNFFIGNYNTGLTTMIENKFDCAVWDTPFNDASILYRYGINTALINPCPLKKGVVLEDGRMPTIQEMDTSILYRCHMNANSRDKGDSVDYINTEEMKEFVEEVLVPICS